MLTTNDATAVRGPIMARHRPALRLARRSSSCCRFALVLAIALGTNAPDLAPPVELGVSLAELRSAVHRRSLPRRLALLAAHRRHLDRWSRCCWAIPWPTPSPAPRPRRRPLLLMLVILPFWTSFLIRVYAWMGLLAENGILNQFLRWIGPRCRSRHHPGHRMGGPSRHRLRLPALHGAAALRHAGEARLPACSRRRPTSAPGRSPPSSPSPCRCRCPASSPAACWCSSRRSASS